MASKKVRNRASKLHLVFDEAKRREFLTGFHKRKVQRKKAAKEKFEQELKDERKRIKSEAKESYKKLVVSYRPIPTLDDLLEEKYEDEEVSVKVAELSTNDIAQQNHWIGANQPTYEESSGDESEGEGQVEELPGMELKENKTRKVVSEKKIRTAMNFKSKKELKKTLKKQATKNVKRSRVFQLKNQMEKQKQRRQSIKRKKLEEKAQQSGKGATRGRKGRR